MTGLWENLRRNLERLTTKQKVQLGLALVATLATVWGVATFVTRVRYATLFRGIESAEAAEVVEALRDRNVPYRLRNGGKVIEVPAGRLDELRMELAGDGLPRGGGVGFEIFDKPAFGLSDFVQSVNYRRALERELGRSIQSLDAVDDARVHLALPDESVFANEDREASASVVVHLHGNRILDRERVSAVVHMVASGVEGLRPQNISVVDGEGRMLTDGNSDGSDAALSQDQLEATRAMESRIESTLLAILEPVVGPGKVRARATVELETARVDRIEERFDPDGAVVRSERKNKTKNEGADKGGAPGTASNLPGGTAGGAATSARAESQMTTTNFEINKTVATIAEPRGGLVRQSVAVVVDNASAVDSGDSTGDGGSGNSVPRTPEEMRKISELVRAAVGIDENRGDVLIVENAPFDDKLRTEAEPEGLDWVSLTTVVLRYLGPVLAVLLVVALVIRPGLKTLRGLEAGGAPTEGSPPTVGELQARLVKGELDTGGGSTLRQKLIEAAAQDPEAAALVVRGWLGREKVE